MPDNSIPPAAGRIVTFGEVMGRLSTPGFQRFSQNVPGSFEFTLAGAEVNVAASLARLGVPVSFVTALPDHAVADAAVASLRAWGVDTRHILRTTSGRMGMFFVEKGIGHRPASVIYDREGSAFSCQAPDSYDWDTVFDGAAWLHISGVTPAISRNACAAGLRAVREAAARGVRVSFDMNFRSRLWKWDADHSPRELAARTVRGFLPFAEVFFGGPDDVELLTGEAISGDDGERHAAAARVLCRQFPNVRTVAMTVRRSLSASHQALGGMVFDAGSGGHWLAPQHDGCFRPRDMEFIVDRLGGGDAFAAGLLCRLFDPLPLDYAAATAFAVAASCLAHTVPGDFSPASREEIEALAAGGAGGRVNR